MSFADKLRRKIADEAARAQAIVDIAATENRDLSNEEKSEVDAILAASDSLQTDLERAVKVEAKVKDILAVRSVVEASKPEAKIPATVKKHSKLKAFKSDEEAYEAGQFLRATIGNSSQAKQWCMDRGILNVHGTSENSKGGYLVPDGFESAIINLREEYGVVRRNGRIYPMSEPIVFVPRRQSGFTAYYVGENAAGTESDASFSQVRLDAKKLMILTRLSQELNDDAILSLADFVANEMAYAFALQEDQAAFLGDGTSTYGGIVGVKNALAAGSLVTAANGDDTFAELEWAFFEEAAAKLPRFPGIRPAWFVHSAMYYTAMVRLANAAGGNTKGDIASGFPLQFMGYPVVLTQVLPSATTTLASSIVGFFGDLGMASTMGSKAGISIVSDTSRYFEYDQIAIRATERFDFVVHEVGTASVAGPMVGLKMGTA